MRKPLVASLVVVQLAVGNSLRAAVSDDPNYTAIIRSNTVQGFPLAVDDTGNLFTVTGTSPSDRLIKIAPDNTTTVLSPAVENVVGVFADLKFGFGGNLFANVGSGGYPSGVAEFDRVTGHASTFYSDPSGYGNGGLAFDSSRQILYVTSTSDRRVIALDSSGQPSVILSNDVDPNPFGMTIEPNGDLLVLGATGHLIRVDPVAKTQQTIADLSKSLPSFAFNKIAVDPGTGTIYFDGENPNKQAFLYSLHPDGTGLTTLASEGPTVTGFIGLAVGPSGDGSHRTSIYLTDPGINEIAELRPVLLGDANGDGFVDFIDLLILARNYGKTSGQTLAQGDFNRDGAVSFDDLLILSQHYGAHVAAGASLSVPVPEPSFLAVLIAPALFMLVRSRRTL